MADPRTVSDSWWARAFANANEWTVYSVRLRRALGSVVASVAVMLLSASTAQASVSDNVLQRAAWPTTEVLGRCHAVVETATADYEGITATAALTARGALSFAMVSSAPMPYATFEAKLCVWADQNANGRIDASEEPSVFASIGSLGWAAGTTQSTAATDLGTAVGRVCARMWIYATYPDGHLSTKRSSTACVDRLAIPPLTVDESSSVPLLGITGAATLGAGGLVAARIAARRRSSSSVRTGSLSADEPADRSRKLRGGRPRR